MLLKLHRQAENRGYHGVHLPSASCIPAGAGSLPADGATKLAKLPFVTAGDPFAGLSVWGPPEGTLAGPPFAFPKEAVSNVLAAGTGCWGRAAWLGPAGHDPGHVRQAATEQGEKVRRT